MIFTFWLSPFPQSPLWDTVLNAANIAFTGIFVIEMFLKLMAIGFKMYFEVGVHSYFGILSENIRGHSMNVPYIRP